MAKRILFATGSTGGHVYPVEAIIQAVRNQNGLVEIELIGSGEILTQVANQLDLTLHQIWSSKLRRYFSLFNFLDIFKLPIAFLQSLYFVWRFMPDLVFAKGGGASFMPALVAKLFFIPIYIHETDAIPGMANRWLGRLATKIFVSFEQSKQYFNAVKVELVGNPIRQELLDGSKAEAMTFFKFNDQKPVVLITGGSQGARNINRIVNQSVVELVKEFQLIHQTGGYDYKNVEDNTKQLLKEGAESYAKSIESNYRSYAFLQSKEMALAYTLADVIVSRGGGAVFELAALGKPIILIPLSGSATDHQNANAKILSQYGATVINEANLTTHIFLQEIRESYANRTTLGPRLHTFARPEAAELIAEALLNSNIK